MPTPSNTYNLSHIFTLRNKNGDSFLVGSFNGFSSFTVFKQNEHAPSIKIAIPRALSLEIVKQLKKLLNSEGASRSPIVIQKYDPTTKSFKDSDVITLVKSDKNLYSIELSSKGNSVVFGFRASAIFSDGTSPMTAEYRSQVGVQEFIQVLEKELPNANLLSTSGASGQSRGGSQSSGGYSKQPSTPKVDDPFGDGTPVF